jgi:hypothetical protein
LKELREEAKDSAAQLDQVCFLLVALSLRSVALIRWRQIQTVQVLDGIPNEEMIAWMEGVVGTLGNGRS